MNNPTAQIAIGLFAVFTLGCGDKQPAPVAEAKSAKSLPDDIAEIATSYQELRLLTPEPVFVNPELAMLCAPASQNRIEYARIEHGPHANCAVRIFMNESAATAFEKKRSYPVGSIVVKEKQRFDSLTDSGSRAPAESNGVGGMIKRASGYDAAHGDWEYFYFENPASIKSGKIESCSQCHQKAAASDYVFADWAKSNNNDPYGK